MWYVRRVDGLRRLGKLGSGEYSMGEGFEVVKEGWMDGWMDGYLYDHVVR